MYLKVPAPKNNNQQQKDTRIIRTHCDEDEE